MPVEITQDEMNILNLNGITADEIKSNVEYMRATGVDDNSIRQHYSNTINELKSITKTTHNDTEKIKEWQQKGSITPYEYAKRKSVEFNGSYNNIDKYANLNLTEEQKSKKEETDRINAQRIADYEKRKLQQQQEDAEFEAKRKAKNTERDKRVNEGTASFLDRLGSYLDRQAEISKRISDQNTSDDLIIQMSGINNERPHEGKINFMESLGNSFIQGGWIPFVGGFIEKADVKKQREIQQHILKGEPIRQDELNFLNHRLEAQKEEAVRGYTWGGNVAHGFLPSLVRFGGEIGTGGYVLKSLGLTAKVAEGASLGEKFIAGTKNIATAGAVNTALPTTYNDTFANFQDRRFNQEMELTDKGTWIFKEADEKPAISFMKSLAQTFVMFASEHSGELLSIPVKGATAAASKYVGTPISKYLFSNPKLVKFVDDTIPLLSKSFEKMKNMPVKGKAVDWLKNTVKYDGFLEEMGEEVVEDVLNLTLGTGDEERTLENYTKAIFKSPDEWAVIAGAIALQGGTLSVASHVLGSYMERNGASDEQIIETLNSLSETEKEQKIDELISEGLIDFQSYENKEISSKNKLKDAYYQQIKNNYDVDDELATSQAEFQAQAFANLAKTIGESTENVSNKANIIYQNLSEQQAQEQLLNDSIAALQGKISYNENNNLIEDELNRLYEEYDALPEDYADENDINNRVQMMQLLEEIQQGNITEENQSLINNLIASYQETNPELAELLTAKLSQKISNDIPEVKFQSIASAGAKDNQTALAKQEWKKKGTESRFFKKWFGDSKVSDWQGNPIVVYHGTENNFKIFKNTGKSRQIGANIGFFFTSNEGMAKQYADDKKVMPVYLSLQNPLVIDANSVIQIFNQNIEIKDAFDFLTQLDQIKSEQEIKEELIKLGYDGIILNNTNVDTRSNEDIHDVYITFYPEQIKSVDNRGTFDAENPNIYFQELEDRNLLMTHSAKLDTLDSILESGSLVAPSMAITKKGEQEALKNFGDVLFVRNPRKIDYQNDNIFDRDIYSPRMPKPSYELENGRIIDSYEFESLKRMNDERFEKSFGSSKEEYLQIKRKVLDLGFTPSGNKKIKAYNANTLLEYMQKNKLLGGENFDYGLSSLLAKLSKQQVSKDLLKKTAKKELNLSSEELTQKYKDIEEKYNHFDDKLEEYYIGNGFVYSDQGDIFYAAIKNNKRKLREYLDLDKMPKELLQEMKNLVNEALSLPRSYFEAKPMRKVDLSEFSYAVVEKGLLSDEQKKNLELWGVKPVEYAKGKLNETIQALDNEAIKVYFQSAYHGTPHRFDEFSLDNIGTGEGAQAHGWGLYFAENKDVSENYRKGLTDDVLYPDKILVNKEEYKQQDKPFGFYNSKGEKLPEIYSRAIGFIRDYGNAKMAALGCNAKIKKLNKDLEQAGGAAAEEIKQEIKSLEKLKYVLENDTIEEISGQLFQVDIPESDVLLDENKSYTEQAQKIKNTLFMINRETKGNLNNELARIEKQYGTKPRGREIYTVLTKIFGSAKAASEKLNQHGVKGITYDGQQDGRCYVVFDDKAINVLKTYYQNIDNNSGSRIENAKGFTYQRKSFDGTTKENIVVLLNNKADKSTLMHEFAHVYLTTLNDLALTNAKAKELLMDVNKWLHYDGVEYTERQHERFANSFVAYVASGKAPSYGLKKVFENFRRWLNNLYSELQASDDVFIDPEAEELFEKLLGDISINAQKEQAEQIINKAKRNAILRYDSETETLKRKINKNQLTAYQQRYRDVALSIIYYAMQHSSIPEAKKYTNYNQLRMILLATPEYKRKNKGVAKMQEEIGNVLAELDDAFSANDGFLSEWSEFFNDTGVSYDTQDIGGDAELASEAFDVLINRVYAEAYPEDLNGEYGEFTEKDETETQFTLEYIIDEYRNADDKTIPLIAFNQWLSREVHPYIADDIQEKWERETNEIDRYQSLSKFQQAKEDLKLYASMLKGHGDYSSQFAEYARAIIKRLDFMNERDKGKLFDKLKEFNSFRDIEKNLDDVMDYAETLADESDRRILSEKIDNEVRQTIHEWKNGIKKTKYTYPANKLFERLRELNKMTLASIQDLYDAIVNEETEAPDYASDEVHDKSYYEILENQFIKYKINGTYNSTEFLQDLLTRIQTAKYTSKIARDEMDYERRMNQINLIDECAKAVNIRKEEIDNNPAIKTAANFNSIGANVNNFLEMIFNEDIKKQFSLDYLFAQRDAKTGAEKRDFEDKAKRIFGLDGRFADTQLYSRFIDMTVPSYKITQRYSPDIEQGTYRITEFDKTTGFNATQYTQQIRQDVDFAEEWTPEEIELSKMEILYYYIQSKNPTSYVILTDREKGQFKQADFDNMLDTLSPQEKLLGDLMQLSAEKYWNQLNTYHIKKYQVELGKVKNYFPRLTDFTEEKPYEIFNSFSQSASSGRMQKGRTAGPGSRIKPANALAVLYDHMETANTISIMGEHLDTMSKVLLNKDLLKKISAVFGNTVVTQYQSAITSMTYKSQSCTKSLTEDFFSNAVNNSVKAAMFAKPTLAIKQVISFMNYGKGDEYVTAAEWAKEFSKQTLTPAKWKSNIDYMMNIPYLKDRYLSGGSMDALKRQLTSMLFPNINQSDNIPKVGKTLRTLSTMGAKLNLLDEYFGKYIAMGDIGAIILGGKPYIECLKNKGYSEEQAIRIFIETTVNDQQSSIPSTLSNAQRNASKQPLAKMFFNFQNTAWQYYRHCTNAIMRTIQNPTKKNITKAGKMLFCYGWLFPAVFSMAGTLSPILAVGGDPDDLFKDINPINTLSTLFTQHPLFGDLLQSVLAGINGEQYNSSNVISTHLKAYNKMLRHLMNQKLTPMDVWSAVAAFGEERTGLPLSTIGSEVSGLYDITQGEFVKGLLKSVGYTDYRAKKILGEE